MVLSWAGNGAEQAVEIKPVSSIPVWNDLCFSSYPELPKLPSVRPYPDR